MRSSYTCNQPIIHVTLKGTHIQKVQMGSALPTLYEVRTSNVLVKQYTKQYGPSRNMARVSRNFSQIARKANYST